MAKAEGDWDDTDASVSVGVEAIEAALTSVHQPAPGRREYRLKRVNGEVGLLVIERGEGDVLNLTASIGPLGDPERERKLVQAVRRRLDQLHGVEFAPVR